jgi:hypothetical protein
MAKGDNKKKVAELEALRDRLNKAERKKDYPVMVEVCQAIIKLGNEVKSLNVMVCLYHKDLGQAYMKLLEFEKAHAHFKTAYDGLVEYRATTKLKYPEDWLNELKVIERLIHRVETVHLK